MGIPYTMCTKIRLCSGPNATSSYSLAHLGRSEKHARHVLERAVALRGKLPEPASIALTALSRVSFGRNQLAQSHQFLSHEATVDPNPTSMNVPAMIGIQRALIQVAQGQAEAAKATLQAAREPHARRPSGLWLDHDLVGYPTLCCLRQSDLAGADSFLREVDHVEHHPLIAYVRAGVLMERKQASTAESILVDTIHQYPHGLFYESILSTYIMLAVALFEQRKVKQAQQVILEAIRRAAAGSFIRPFLDYGDKIAGLLTLILQTGAMGGEGLSFIREILGILDPGNGVLKTLSESELEALSRIAAISAREQDVLLLLSVGLSNSEIAGKLAISENTVKTHLENIYRKLGVNSRTQAIAQLQAFKAT